MDNITGESSMKPTAADYVFRAVCVWGDTKKAQTEARGNKADQAAIQRATSAHGKQVEILQSSLEEFKKQGGGKIVSRVFEEFKKCGGQS